MSIKYGQMITETVNDDSTISIVTEGYYNGPASIKQQFREDIKTSHDTLLTDVIKCLELISNTSTPELIIRITKDQSGVPTMIQKTWLISKQKIK